MAEDSNGSPHRVAYDLAITIARAEGKHTATPHGDRKYWLELYSEVQNVVVKGHRPKSGAGGGGPQSVEPDEV
jgi:hypothetical protein